MCFVKAVRHNFVLFLLLCTLVRGKVLALHSGDIFTDESLSSEAK